MKLIISFFCSKSLGITPSNNLQFLSGEAEGLSAESSPESSDRVSSFIGVTAFLAKELFSVSSEALPELMAVVVVFC